MASGTMPTVSRNDELSSRPPVHNENPRPFIWTKSADQILASVARFCRRTLDSAH